MSERECADFLEESKCYNGMYNIDGSSMAKEEAMEYFIIFQEMFNGYFQSNAYENTDFNSLIKDHEMMLSKLLNMMLYGITKEDSKL